MPDSVRKHYTFRPILPRAFMERDEGKNCPA